MAGCCRYSISLSVVHLLSVRFLSWSEFVNAMTAYLNCLKSSNQTKLHVTLKNAISIFSLYVLRLAEMYAGKAYSGTFSLDQRLRRRSRIQR